MTPLERQEKIYDAVVSITSQQDMADLMVLALRNHLISLYENNSNTEFVSFVNETVEKDQVPFDTIMSVASKNLAVTAGLIHITESFATAYLRSGDNVDEFSYTHSFTNTKTNLNTLLRVDVHSTVNVLKESFTDPESSVH